MNRIYTGNQIQDCHGKGSFQQEQSFNHSMGLKFKNETSKVLHLECSFPCCRKPDTPNSKAEIPGPIMCEIN
jgi:hypothetical protein